MLRSHVIYYTPENHNWIRNCDYVVWNLQGTTIYIYLCIIDWGLKELSEVLVIWEILISCLLPGIYGLPINIT